MNKTLVYETAQAIWQIEQRDLGPEWELDAARAAEVAAIMDRFWARATEDDVRRATRSRNARLAQLVREHIAF